MENNINMGLNYGKLELKESVKIYKRVSLLEARKRFSAIDDQRKSSPVFEQYPISRNFFVEYCVGHELCLAEIDMELSGSFPSLCKNCASLKGLLKTHLLDCQVDLSLVYPKINMICYMNNYSDTSLYLI
jgi:hypothetical protein